MFLIDRINALIKAIADLGNAVLFFNVAAPLSGQLNFPFLALWLLIASAFCFIKFRFFTFKFLSQAVKSLLSKKNNYEQLKHIQDGTKGYQTSRSILAFNIGSSVDLGSIFGIAGAVSVGGAGVIFWIIAMGFVSAGIRFAEAVAGHVFRKKDKQGNFISGGPNIYIGRAFAMIKMPVAGRVISFAFSACLAFSTFCSLQVNQTVMVITHFIPSLESHLLWLSFAIATIIFAILTRGFYSISGIFAKVVPVMSLTYVAATLAIIVKNSSNLLPTFSMIFSEAFSLKAGTCGLLSVIAIATQRAFFCSETGMGSAAIAHSGSACKNAIVEGFIATLGPIITTSIVCFCSGIIVVVANTFHGNKSGIEMMIDAFATVHPYFPFLLLLVVPLFGLSTAIAWAYYGQKVWASLFGAKMVVVYNLLLFISYCVCGVVKDFGVMLNLADVMNLSITIPNILAIYVLSGFISKKLKKYNKSQS